MLALWGLRQALSRLSANGWGEPGPVFTAHCFASERPWEASVIFHGGSKERDFVIDA
jgi:hypothetical protein